MKHSLLRESLCDMLDYGVYDDRKVIIMPRLGLDWIDYLEENRAIGFRFESFCSAARYAVGIESENELHS